MTCRIEGCGKPKSHRGLCHAHYKKLLIYGDPLAGTTKVSKGEIEAFLSFAKIYTGDKCLIWPFARNSAGYGHLAINCKHVLAHRIVCESVNGPAPFERAEAAHLCGNGHNGCVARRHLEWKSRTGNCADMIAHGKSQRGERQHAARLTTDDVKFIWDRRDLSSAEIARRLNVCAGTIVAVRARKTWKWLTDTFDADTRRGEAA